MTSHSPYHVSASAATEWMPGEKVAAGGFVALVIFLVVEMNVSIHRAFRKRQGLYYYSMLIGTWGCAIDANGIVKKNFLPPTRSRSSHVWTVALLCLLGGWSLYAPAQLLVTVFPAISSQPEQKGPALHFGYDHSDRYSHDRSVLGCRLAWFRHLFRDVFYVVARGSHRGSLHSTRLHLC